MTREEAIKEIKWLRNMVGMINDNHMSEALGLAIEALQLVNDFESAQIITGGRLNGRTYAYKCGLADGLRLAKGEKTIPQESEGNWMDKPIKRSDLYVCWNAQGFTEFTPIAVVLEKTDRTVTYARYLDHGRIYDKTVMIYAKDFDFYYHPVNDIEYDVLKCLGHMNLCDEDSEGR